jgi:hypothetical protein
VGSTEGVRAFRQKAPGQFGKVKKKAEKVDGVEKTKS